MANYYEDNEDLKYYVEGGGIDWEPIVKLTEYDWQSQDGFRTTDEAVEFYKEVLDMIGGFVSEQIGDKSAEFDKAKPKVVDGEVVYPPVFNELFDQIAELGLHGLAVPRELGGMNAPILIFMMQNELFARADVSVCAHHGFHGGIAMAALMYSIMEGSTTFDQENGVIEETRFADLITEIAEGTSWGSMDITESDAGSDMAAMRSRGVLGEDGVWRVTGQKIYITSGHGKWHFLIARTEEPVGEDAFAGLKGLSMFLVPAYSDNEDGTRTRHSTIDGVEEKLGHNASATVSISFEDAPAQLIGQRGEGFKYMLLLMNNARVGVGFESLGLCESAYRMAKSYAEERPSMGKTIDRHEMIAEYLEGMKTDIQAIRALCVHACIAEEMNQKLNIKLSYFPPEDEAERAELEKERKRHMRKSRSLTPLLKYYASERAVEMARMCIQIHGGAGYTTDYGAEKLLRDAMVFPIYEGTSQIQALMAMKDNLLGVIKNPTGFYRRFARARVKSLRGSTSLERRVAKLQLVKFNTIQFLLNRLAANKVFELRNHKVTDWSDVMTGWDPKRDFALAMLHAERLIKILIDVHTAEELLIQAKRHPQRAELLERWLERAEPRCRYWQDEIQTTGLRLLESLQAEDAEAQTKAAAK